MKIPVTKPSLPDLSELSEYLSDIWASKSVSNFGKYHQIFEDQLRSYLGVQYLSLCSNGTLSLLIALKALDIKKDVVTTPYTFPATTTSLIWLGLRPVFVDIEQDSYNIDPSLIKKVITNSTSAILATHCYGFPCKVDEIQSIAKNHGLKVIYDAAPAFGVDCHCGSLLNHGDISILSFHATKVFNTIEGGAIITSSQEIYERVNALRNFGFNKKLPITYPGINAKMNEIQAAIGILQLKNIDEQIQKRKLAAQYYLRHLNNIRGINLPDFTHQIAYNYSYFPILVGDDFPLSRDELQSILISNQIDARIYYSPLTSSLDIYSGCKESPLMHDLANANVRSNQILCLPIFSDITESELERVVYSVINPITHLS